MRFRTENAKTYHPKHPREGTTFWSNASHTGSKTENNRFRVPILFATNRFTSEKFPLRLHCYTLHTTFSVRTFFHFHDNEFDELPWKLDSTENPFSFEKYPTSP